MNRSLVSNISCMMGEVSAIYSAASGFEEVIRGEAMLNIPVLWGWGDYCFTEDVYSMALESARKTLNGSQLSPDDIDLVIFCACFLPDSKLDIYLQTAKILQSLDIKNANVVGITLGGCATVLNAMIMGSNLVRANAYRNILVVAIDALPEGLPRFKKFGLLSDASVAFLISQYTNEGFEIVSSSYQNLTKEMIVGADWKKPELAIASVSQALKNGNISNTNINRIFSNNTFLPIKTLKEKSIGFTTEQLYLDNVVKIGHCFACDSIINYHYFKANNGKEASDYYLLHAEADGHSASIVIKEL